MFPQKKSCMELSIAAGNFVNSTGLADGLALFAGPILDLRSANERRRYFVMTSLIGWVQAYPVFGARASTGKMITKFSSYIYLYIHTHTGLYIHTHLNKYFMF